MNQDWKTRVLSTACLFGLIAGSGGSLGLCQIALADALDTWTVRHSGTSLPLVAVAYGAGKFVVLNALGAIFSSEDGTTWTPRPHEPVGSLTGITYGNGLFVAVGGTDWPTRRTVLTSADGITWTTQVSVISIANGIDAVTFGSGLFVAVGDSGTTSSSPDAKTWTETQSPTPFYLGDVTFGNGVFLAMGGESLLSSTNGTNWTWTLGEDMTDGSFTGGAFGNSTFVVLGPSGPITELARIQTSADGFNWTEGAAAASPSFDAITYGAGLFVAVGGDENKRFPDSIETSPDGVNWTPRHPATAGGLLGVAFGNGTFVAVGRSGRILQSGIIALPKISMARDGDHLLISWPLSSTGFVLERTQNLLAAWEPERQLPSAIDDQYVTAVKPEAILMFYRLR
jgi:hypothetical protein